MSDEIKLPITAQITDITVDAAANTRAADAIGGGIAEASEKSSTAMKGVKLAAKEMFHEFGVGGPLSRVLSSETMHLAEGLGSVAVGAGVAGMAVMTAYGIYNHFVEKQKEADQASISHADSLWKEVQAFEGLTPMTKAETDATYELYTVKRKNAKFALEEGIEAKMREAQAAQDAYEKTLGSAYSFYNDFGELQEFTLGADERASEKAMGRLHEITGDLQLMQAHLDRIKSTAAMSKQAMFGPKTNDLLTEEYNSEAAAKDHLQAWNDYVSTRFQIQAALYADNKAMIEEYNVSVYNATVQRMEWDNQEAENKRRALDGSLSAMASSFQIMYQSGFSHANATLNLYKMAASAEAMVSADRAAGAALAWGTELGGPALGIAMGSVVFLAGMARVKDIWSRKLGDTGGAGGSVPTYSVSSTTGETQGGGQSAPNVYISMDGGKTYSKQQVTYDVVNEIWRNNGTIDGKTFAVERSM